MSYDPPVGLVIGPPSMKRIEKGETIHLSPPGEFTEMGEVQKQATGPTIVRFGIVRTHTPETDTTFEQVHRVWIAPEIARRVAAGSAVDELTPLRQALVVFPPRSAPERHRVLLNNEVGVRAAIRPSYATPFLTAAVGQEMELSLRDMFDMREFGLEGVDMDRDGFAWMRPEAGGWALYFNFIPSEQSRDGINDVDRERLMRQVRDAIAQEMLRGFARGVFTDDPRVRDAMAIDGWCPTPILLPDPWRSMCAAYARQDPSAAEALAIAAVRDVELDTMLGAWLTEEPFASDRAFLERGIAHYKAADYISAVSVLMPRIEGLANRVRSKRGIGARDSISQVFKSLDELASADVRDGYIATRIREEFKALISSFLLAHFRPTDPGADAARGRHAHAHGATGDPHYDQAYALKVILALDALYFVAR